MDIRQMQWIIFGGQLVAAIAFAFIDSYIMKNSAFVTTSLFLVCTSTITAHLMGGKES